MGSGPAGCKPANEILCPPSGTGILAWGGTDLPVSAPAGG